jgi:hypothetical protein
MVKSLLKANTPENENRLKSIGLSETALRDLGVRVLGAFNKATPNDTVTAAGSYAYLEGVKSSRDIFCRNGWVRHPLNGLELIKNLDGNIFLGISSGDKFTGVAGNIQPSTKNNKGPQTGHLISQNSEPRFLFPELTEARQKAIKNSEQIWYFLYHIDLDKREFRSEVSLPININTETMKINEWSDRILLQPIEFGESVKDIDLNDYAEEIPFDIKRKANE